MTCTTVSYHGGMEMHSVPHRLMIDSPSDDSRTNLPVPATRQKLLRLTGHPTLKLEVDDVPPEVDSES